MEKINLDRNWEFRRGFVDSKGMLGSDGMILVDLPHDGMISTPTSPDAPAVYDSGYFCGDMSNYTKYVSIPAEWENEIVGLLFDGIMMHSTVEINGCKVGEHHYGYSPFYVDISRYVSFGETNRITINVNTGIQPSSRWYTGSGLFRGVTLCHSPRVHIAHDGIFVWTKEVSDGIAYLQAEVELCNESLRNVLTRVNISLVPEQSASDSVPAAAGMPVSSAVSAGGVPVASCSQTVQISAGCRETAHIAFTVKNPLIWDADSPLLYRVCVLAEELGEYRTHLIEDRTPVTDSASVLFGIRTVTADAVRGLRINGKTVKLKGGCVHHDNGLLGAVSLYDAEARKIAKLKEVGFNAIRTAHNPPSAALVEACDRLGMYIFDEAFDAWGMAKRPGDFSTYFSAYGFEYLTDFIRRDRVHPSVIMWSTGNEIPERGGLANGYTVAAQLAAVIHRLDGSRPVSNGICSLWSGLDDCLSDGQSSLQNASNKEALSWDRLTESFTNGLDVVGYNYMEDLYENSHRLFPDRVILGSENFPKEIGFRWPYIEKLPYVIGDFTWTCWDYIGEAGIGKSVFVNADDPLVSKGSWVLMPPTSSPYPWRLANDADFDITGRLRPQGAYRSTVWGSTNTYLYSYLPDNFGKTEVISMWGFTDVHKRWNYKGFEGKPVEVIVFSGAEEVELLLNGRSLGRKYVSKDRPLPNSVRFDTMYEPGVLEAVSYSNGKEISRDTLETSSEPADLVLTPSAGTLSPDGHSLLYIDISVVDSCERPVTDAEIKLTASVSTEQPSGRSVSEYEASPVILAGFGTGRPVTEENFTDNTTVTFEGHATAILRSGYEACEIRLSVDSQDGTLHNELKLKCQ